MAAQNLEQNTSTLSSKINKPILGLIEEITLIDAKGVKRQVLAKIDTGADSSSIDSNLAKELALGPIVRTKNVVSSHGTSIRPIVALRAIVCEKELTAEFNLYNRSHMTYRVLIGRNILTQGFLIDPSKNEFSAFTKKDVSLYDKQNKPADFVDSKTQKSTTNSKKKKVIRKFQLQKQHLKNNKSKF
jgi:hypothetical protein